MKALLVVAILVGCNIIGSEGDKLDWDELKFTQEWGHSACLQFKDAPGHSGKTCRFEGQPSIWSIHGIWPTKIGTSGPNFCSKVTFDIGMLEPIMPGLKEFWYEIDADKDAHHFWEHEWLKHGSCAKELDTFSTELKYFQGALDLRSKLDLYSVLKSGGGVIPTTGNGGGYTLDAIHAAFKSGLKTESAVPVVQCLKTKNARNEVEYHLLAVEICLDQNLQILDCSKKVEGSGGKLGDQAMPCPHDAPILYMDYQPKTKHDGWNKATFIKNLPIPSKYWKKMMNFKRQRSAEDNKNIK